MDNTTYYIRLDEKAVYMRCLKDERDITDPSFPYETKKLFKGSLQECKAYMDIITLGYTNPYKNRRG